MKIMLGLVALVTLASFIRLAWDYAEGYARRQEVITTEGEDATC